MADLLQHTPYIPKLHAFESSINTVTTDRSKGVGSTIVPSKEFGGGSQKISSPFLGKSDASVAPLGPDMLLDIEKTYIRDWDLPPPKPIQMPERPADPVAKWVRDESTGFELQIVMPTDQEVRNTQNKRYLSI